MIDRDRDAASRHTGPWVRRAVAGLVVAAVLAGCVGDDQSATPDPTSTSTEPTTTTTTTAEAGGATAPITDAGSAIDWFVAVLNGAPLTAEEYEARFSEEFRQEVPFDTAFEPSLDPLRAGGPYTVAEPPGEGLEGQALIAGAGGVALRVSVRVDEAGIITGLLTQPGDPPTLEDPPATVDEAFARLAELGTTRALAAEVTGDGCTPIAALDPDQAAPLGSVFKLYVLAELAEQIAAGETSWDAPITIRDELKSLPTGILQERPDGDVVTVQEAAALMISISDNTATDLLIHHLGRERVEAAMAELGAAEGNVPLLTTRDLFVLKLGPPELLEAYLEADADGRRAVLEEAAGVDLDQLDPARYTSPVEVDRVEWFASPDQLCAVAVHLGQLAQQEGLQPIDEVLSINPGIPPTGTPPESLWFKGGSEPGMVAGWWRTTAGGRTFLVTGSVVDTEALVDETQALLLLAAARDLLTGS